jgi:hypothetical protein
MKTLSQMSRATLACASRSDGSIGVKEPFAEGASGAIEKGTVSDFLLHLNDSNI